MFIAVCHYLGPLLCLDPNQDTEYGTCKPTFNNRPIGQSNRESLAQLKNKYPIMQMETLVWKESVWHRSTIVDQQAEADPQGKGWEGPPTMPPKR